MSTPVIITGWEHGVSPTANGGGMCYSVTGTPSVVTTQKHSGSYSMECVGSSSQHYMLWNLQSVNPTTLVGVVYFRWHTAPASAIRILRFTTSAGGSPAIYFDPSDNKLYGYIGVTGNKNSVALSQDTWYRIDFKAVSNASAHTTLDFKVNGTDTTQQSVAQTDTVINGLYVGSSTSDTYDIFYDDLVISYTGADYPIGPVGIELIKPGSDGTHNAGTNVIEDNAGTDIGTTSAYDKMNSVPMGDTTVYVKQSATGTGNYAEVLMSDIVAGHSSIVGAQGWLAYRASGTTANEGGCIMSKDSFSTNTEIYGNPTTRQDYSETSVFWKSAILANVNNDTTVNGLKARVGYSNNVASVPWWVDLGVEVAYVPSTESASESASMSTSPSSSQSASMSASMSSSMSSSPSVGYKNYSKGNTDSIQSDPLDFDYTPYTAQELTDVSTENDIWVTQFFDPTETLYISVHQFKEYCQGHQGIKLKAIAKSSIGTTPFLPITLGVWNAHDSSWEWVASNTSASPNVPVTLNATLSPASNYIISNGTIVCRLFQITTIGRPLE